MATLRTRIPDKPKEQWYFVADATVTEGCMRLYYYALPNGSWYGVVYLSRITHRTLMGSEKSIRKLAEGQLAMVETRTATNIGYLDMEPGESSNPMVVTEKLLHELLAMMAKGEDVTFLYPTVMGTLADHEEFVGRLRHLADLVGEVMVRSMEVSHAV
jgi:hypothetical protein